MRSIHIRDQKPKIRINNCFKLIKIPDLSNEACEYFYVFSIIYLKYPFNTYFYNEDKFNINLHYDFIICYLNKLLSNVQEFVKTFSNDENIYIFILMFIC